MPSRFLRGSQIRPRDQAKSLSPAVIGERHEAGRKGEAQWRPPLQVPDGGRPVARRCPSAGSAASATDCRSTVSTNTARYRTVTQRRIDAASTEEVQGS